MAVFSLAGLVFNRHVHMKGESDAMDVPTAGAMISGDPAKATF
jgi:hypothetical protein